MKKFLFFLLICGSCLASGKEVDLEQFYTTYKNAIFRWDGQIYKEIAASDQPVQINIENKFIYIYDKYGNHSIYKYSGFHKNSADTMISRALDNSGTYCELIVNVVEGGLSLSIVYSEQVIIKYFLKGGFIR